MSKYDELAQQIQSAPRIWLPSLIEVVVRAAYKKDSLVPGRASVIVSRVEAELGKKGDRDE